MPDQFPLVSVIIPAYNAEPFIHDTLVSVLGQTYHNLEIWVVDDGSQDRTAEIVQNFVDQDDRVHLLQQANAGVAAARNLAIQAAQGEYIAPIDADDIWFPQKLEKQVECMLAAEPIVGVVYAWSVDIDEAGLLTGGVHDSEFQGKVYPFLVYKNFLGHASAPLIRQTCLAKVGGYNAQLRAQNAQGCEDLELYLRLAEHFEFRVVKEFLIGYRKLVGSMSCDYTAMAKSYHLVQAEVSAKYPEISGKIARLSGSNFYIYLARQSAFNGNHRNNLFWLAEAFQQHWMILGHPQFYWLFLKGLLKDWAQPLTCLIWPDHRSWVRFKRKFQLGRQSKTLDQIQRWRLILQPLYRISVWKLYEGMQLNQFQRQQQGSGQAPEASDVLFN